MVVWGIVMTVQGLVHDFGGLMGISILLYSRGFLAKSRTHSCAMVSWCRRGRLIPRSQLLSELLVQAFRVWTACSAFLLRSYG